MMDDDADKAEALSAMGSLALGLAHEVRNPLNAAVLQLHLLSRGLDRLTDDKARTAMRSRVTIVEGEIARLERLLTEFLELARPRGIRHEQVDVAHFAGGIASRRTGAVTVLLWSYPVGAILMTLMLPLFPSAKRIRSWQR